MRKATSNERFAGDFVVATTMPVVDALLLEFEPVLKSNFCGDCAISVTILLLTAAAATAMVVGECESIAPMRGEESFKSARDCCP